MTTDAHPEPIHLMLRVDFPHLGELARAWTDGLSPEGTLIVTEQRFPVGERLRLGLGFPGLMEPLSIDAEVLGEQDPSVHHAAGMQVRFLPSSPDLARLRALVEAAGREPGKGTGRGYRILLVEDNPHTTELYGYALKRVQGVSPEVSVEFADNGLTAMERLNRAPAVDLVITDLHMPVMDGFTLISRMRADPRFKATPVFVITAGDQEAREQVLDLGVQAFMHKPVRLAQIVETVRTLLHLG
ncbi:MAG: response regulator [Myxococcota bacterium]